MPVLRTVGLVRGKSLEDLTTDCRIFSILAPSSSSPQDPLASKGESVAVSEFAISYTRPIISGDVIVE